jgi:hypothetical protein
VPIRAASEWKSTVARGMAEEEDDPAGEGGVRRVTVRVAPVEVMSLARPSAEACLDPRAVRSTPAFSARGVAVSLVRGAKLEGEFEERCLASRLKRATPRCPSVQPWTCSPPDYDLAAARIALRSGDARKREVAVVGDGRIRRRRRRRRASVPASLSCRAARSGSDRPPSFNVVRGGGGRIHKGRRSHRGCTKEK